MVKRRSGQAGLTIVELLVTIVIASVVSVATFTFFAGQQRIYDVQTELLNMQQNLWASMETLARYARASGGGMSGCVADDPDGPGPKQGDPVPGGATMPLTGLRVWNDPNFVRVPPLWIRNGAGGAPDMITVAYGEGSSGGFTDAMLRQDIPPGASTAPIIVQPTMSAAFVVGEFGLLVESGLSRQRARLHAVRDHRHRRRDRHAVAQRRHVDVEHPRRRGGHGAPHGVRRLAPPFPVPNPEPTGGVRNFGRLVIVQFAINSVGAPATPPSLTMNILTAGGGPQVLAEGIEDMQIAYACDLQPLVPDGVLIEGTDPATRLADEWTYNEAGDVPWNGCKRPAGIRITLVARSINTDTTLTDFPNNAKPAAEDGVAGAINIYRHRIATTTVYPRN